MSGNQDAFGRPVRSRSRGGCGRDLLGAALALGLLVAIAVFVLEPVHTLLFAPWSIGRDGSPTLTGTWVGPLRSRWGSDYYLYLDLKLEPPRLRGRRGSRRSRRSPRADLVGEARVCNQAGKEFRLSDA